MTFSPGGLFSSLVSIREIVMTAGPFAVLAVGVLVLAYWWMNPTPPKRVTLATGPERSAGETFGNADFFYAPVVSRFHSYDVALSGAAKAYADRVWHHPFMREWLKGAAQEVADGLV